MRKSLKILFTASVLLNVLLFGSHAAITYKHWANHPWQQAKSGLSPEARNVVARSFRASRDEIKPLAKKARAERQKLMKVFQAEEFDEEAFDKIVEDMQKHQSEIMTLKIQTMKDIAKELPPEERAKMAKKFVEALDRQKKRRRNSDTRWKHPHVPEEFDPNLDMKPETKPSFGPETDPGTK